MDLKRINREVIYSAGATCVITFLYVWILEGYGLNFADEGFLWYGTQRAFEGEIPLLDFQSYEIGRYYWGVFWFWVSGGDSLFHLRLSNALFGSIGIFASIFLMRKLGLSWYTCIAIGVAVAIWYNFPRHKPFVKTFQITTTLSLFYLLSNPHSRKIQLLTGCNVGVAALFGCNLGVYSLFATGACLALARFAKAIELRKECLLNLGYGILIGYAPMIALFLMHGGFRDAYVEILGDLLTGRHAQIALVIPFPWVVERYYYETLADFSHIAHSFSMFLVPLSYGIGLVLAPALIRKKDPCLILATASVCAGIPYFHHCLARADVDHLAQALFPFLFLVVAAGLYSMNYRKIGKFLAPCAIGIIAILTFFIYLANVPLFKLQRLSSESAPLAAIEIDGNEFVDDSKKITFLKALSEEVNSHGTSQETIFIAPHYPFLYSFLKVKAPWKETFFLWERNPEWQREHIEEIEANPPEIALIDPEATYDNLPGLKFKNANGLVWHYILSNFEQNGTIEQANNIHFQVFIRK
jgi:hypothetical protein